MKPFIIGVGGGHSGAGKTEIACRIFHVFAGWGAIKCTKTSLYGSITDDINVLSEDGKDTRRFLDSGADKVLWVRAPHHELQEILPVAIEMLSHLKGIIIEGNSAIEVLKPDVVVFVSGPEGKIKAGAERVLRLADAVVFDDKVPQETSERCKVFSKEELQGFLEFILKAVEKRR